MGRPGGHRLAVRLDPEYAAPVLRGLAPTPKKAIRAALRKLSEDPDGRSTALDVRELDREGRSPRVFRLRVGVWRVAFVRYPQELRVIRIFHREDGYGWLERFG